MDKTTIMSLDWGTERSALTPSAVPRLRTASAGLPNTSTAPGGLLIPFLMVAVLGSLAGGLLLRQLALRPR